ncbi:alkylated DNA repair protein alkB homolog 8-like [Meleagris gallopavo]|uniref:alkylated DNA repair protein alkB homolog 8-like n=1 Tax=Meleagris gallopavo TaxID=9103 RepID=UPI0012ABFA90|nr:alkylated DNA repair protein alkB homolog 8-like [Meleagris gallopavo]
MSRHQLHRIVENYGMVEALLMPPNKPYSFVKYESTEEAKKAFDALNGKEVTLEDSDQKIVLYCNFVEKVCWKNSIPTSLPPDLKVIENVISPEEERKMLESIDWRGDENTQNGGQNQTQKTLKHRRVKHFGYEFRYDNNDVDKDKPLPGGLPEICISFLEKCLKQGYIKHKPDQLTVNQYEPGQGIPPHIDTHSAFEDEIISLSLGSEVNLIFVYTSLFYWEGDNFFPIVQIINGGIKHQAQYHTWVTPLVMSPTTLSVAAIVNDTFLYKTL